MKPFIKIYAGLSAFILFALFALAAFSPEAYATVIENGLEVYKAKQQFTEIYTYDYNLMKSIVLYSFSLYLANIVLKLIVLALAYVSEDRFNVRITLYVFVINIVVLYLSYTIVKLFLEGGIKGISKLVGARKR